jgi:hypothetical protein
VVSTYDRVCPSQERKLSEIEQSDDLRALSILLVEDSPVVADALKQHLELFGATVVGPAATTAEAREVILRGRPDVAWWTSICGAKIPTLLLRNCARKTSL